MPAMVPPARNSTGIRVTALPLAAGRAKPMAVAVRAQTSSVARRPKRSAIQPRPATSTASPRLNTATSRAAPASSSPWARP